MNELFNRRKTDLEVAAKNTIVEIHLIKDKIDEMKNVLEVKDKYLAGINAALLEIEYISNAFKNELEKVEDERD